MLKTTFKTTVQDEKKLTVSDGIEEGKYFVVSLEPLEQGFGHTMGNSLRRVLLSSTKGAAIIQVKIKGVNHQFTTLSGMSEDIVEFVLNLKQVRLNMGDQEEITIKLEKKGSGQVKAKDLVMPAGTSVANPNLVLATLAGKKSSLEAEIIAKVGVGYKMAETKKVSGLGVIPVDAFYSPIRKVAYKVEATRVGRVTNFDKLILELWTDGTVDPKAVIEEAARMLVIHFKQVYDPVDEPVEEETEVVSDNESLSLTVEELDIPTRIANALRKGGYKTVKDLVSAPVDEVTKVKNLGEKSVEIVAKALDKKGVKFGK